MSTKNSRLEKLVKGLGDFVLFIAMSLLVHGLFLHDMNEI